MLLQIKIISSEISLKFVFYEDDPQVFVTKLLGEISNALFTVIMLYFRKPFDNLCKFCRIFQQVLSTFSKEIYSF